jgi:P4 family phage/plasmid primase-like protien
MSQTELACAYDEANVAKMVDLFKSKRDEFNQVMNEMRVAAKKSSDHSVKWADEYKRFIVDKARGNDPANGLAPEDVFDLGDQAELSEKLAIKLEKSGPVVFDYGQFWQMKKDTMVWEPMQETDLQLAAMKFSGAPIMSGDNQKRMMISANTVNGAITLFKAGRNRSARAGGQGGYFDNAPPGVMFRNMFLRFDAATQDVKMESKSDDHRAVVGFNFDYSHTAKPTPMFDAYIESVFAGDEDKDQKIELFLQVLGSALCGLGDVLQKATVLYDNTERSQGANGKSVALKILKTILPPWAVSSISPVSFEERFARAGLVGRRVNLVTEMPEDGDFISGEHTKAIISGDPIQAEFKGKDIFFFQPKAVHIVACNRFPRVRDNTDAFWRRWQVLAFNNSFHGDQVQRDLDRLIIERERDGVVLKLIHAAIRLVAAGGYIEPPSSLELWAQWKMESNPVAMFFEDKAGNVKHGRQTDRGNSTHSIRASDLYAVYLDYCRQNGFRAVSSTRFGRDASAIVEKYTDRQGTHYRADVDKLDQFGTNSPHFSGF